MKLTNKQVERICIGMTQLSQDIKDGKLRLETGTSFLAAIAKKKLIPVYEAFTETREELIDSFILRDSDGQKKKIPAQKDSAGNVTEAEQWDLGTSKEQYAKEVKTLLLTEVEVDRLTSIKRSDFKIKRVKSPDGKTDEEGDIDPDILFLLVPWLVLED